VASPQERCEYQACKKAPVEHDRKWGHVEVFNKYAGQAPKNRR
jgi:hypothetical protein